MKEETDGVKEETHMADVRDEEGNPGYYECFMLIINSAIR